MDTEEHAQAAAPEVAARPAGPAPRVRMEDPEPGLSARAHSVRVTGQFVAAGQGEVRVKGPDGTRELTTRPIIGQPFARRFSAVLDVSRWPPGTHDVEVTVVDGEGQAGVVSRTVTVDPHAAYADHRADAAGNGRQLLPSGDTSVLVVLRDAAARRDAQDRLRSAFARQAGVEHELLVDTADDLGSALSALLASRHDLALIVRADAEPAAGALACFAAVAELHPDADAFYADSEWARAAAGMAPVSLRPGWSPELLLQHDYVGPYIAVGRRAATAAARRPDPPRDVRELLLSIGQAAKVVHVCRTLAVRLDEPPEGEPEILATAPPAPPPRTHVSAIVCTSHARPGLLARCLESLREVAERIPLDVVLVDAGGPARAAALSLGEELELPMRAVTGPEPFNYSAACNRGAAAATGSELLFLNDDVYGTGAEWLDRLRAWLQRPGVGLVGAKLVFPDGTVQHNGVVAGPWRVDNLGAGWPGTATGPDGLFARTRNTTAVTGACVLVDRALFDALGGFDTAMALEFSDVDLALRAARAGARTVWTPEATLVHEEHGTRGGDIGLHPQDDQRFFRTRWRDLLAGGDPFMHPASHWRDDFEPVSPLSHTPISREAPWSRGGRGLVARPPDPMAVAVEADVAAELAAERDSWRAAAELNGQKRDAVRRERDAVAEERDALAAERDALRDERDVLSADRDNALEDRRTVVTSRSWRLTAPLRRAGERLRRR